MAESPEPSLEELLWTIAVARIVLGPHAHLQAPPNLSYTDFPRLLDAGIDDWGGVSPVTIDHVNPEAPWPELELLRAGTESRDLELAPRLPVYPEWISAEWIDPNVLPSVLRASDSLGLAREDGWSPGEDAGIPFVPRDALPIDTRAELGEEEIVRLFRARGHERDRVYAAADQPQARGLRRRGDATSSRATSSTRTSVTSAAGSVPSRRESWRRTCAARHTSCRTRRSCAAARRPGSAARPRSACRAGSTRRSPATTTSRSCVRSRKRCPACTCMRSRRSRCGRGCDARPAARRVPRGTGRGRSRVAAGNGGRDPR